MQKRTEYQALVMNISVKVVTSYSKFARVHLRFLHYAELLLVSLGSEDGDL